MSFEGDVQCICANGHRFNRDVYDSHFDDSPAENSTEECWVPVGEYYLCNCGAKSVFENIVDNTNCDSDGYIRDREWEQFKITDDKYETCDHCGHSSLVKKATYRIPTREEVQPLRTYVNDDGCICWSKDGSEYK
jgi:hypothetical protein